MAGRNVVLQVFPIGVGTEDTAQILGEGPEPCFDVAHDQ